MNVFFSGLELHFIDKDWLKLLIFKVSVVQQQNSARHSRIRIRAGISAGITVSVSSLYIVIHMNFCMFVARVLRASMTLIIDECFLFQGLNYISFTRNG